MVCISNEVHSLIKIQANENVFFIVVASGSGEQSNAISGGAILQTKSPVNIENEPITWNWNPHAISKSHSENKTNHNDEYSLSYNCYGQTLNKLMGEFNVNKRNDKIGTQSNENQTKPLWSSDGQTENNDTNFWTDVLFTNNNNDQRRSSDLLASAEPTATTATSSNSISSNLTETTSIDMHSSDVFNRNFNIMAPSHSRESQDLGKSHYNPSTLSAKNMIRKRKNMANRQDHQSTSEEAAGSDLNRMKLKNDLNATNNTFLQALHDLRLDYHDLTTTTDSGASDQTSQATSKNRYIFLSEITNLVHLPIAN